MVEPVAIDFALPITKDAQGTGISHFQLYQDGKRGDRTTKSNRPLNSAEMHSDGCIYFAFTPTTSPIWSAPRRRTRPDRCSRTRPVVRSRQGSSDAI